MAFRFDSGTANNTARTSLAGVIFLTLFCGFFAAIGIVIWLATLLGYGKTVVPWWAIVLLPGVLIVFGIGMPFFSWRRYLRQLRGDVTAQSSRRTGPVGLALFFSIFLIVGLIVTYLTFVKPTLGWWAAKSWKPVKCTVLSSRVVRQRAIQTQHNNNGPTYSVRIKFRYHVGHKAYIGSRYSFASWSSSDRSFAANLAHQFHKGQTTRCFVDPKDPMQAVLDRDWTTGMWLGLLPLIFVVVGAGGIVGAIIWAKHRQTWGDQKTWLHEAPDEGAGDPVTFSSGSVRLKKLIGVSLFALIWNGFVSVLAYFMVTGKTPVMADLIISAFVLVGLGMLFVAVPYQLIAMMNPKTTVTLGDRHPRLGQTVDVSWDISGATARLRDFRIVLQAREEATYRVGTNTRTDKRTVREIPIFKSDAPPGHGAHRLGPGDNSHRCDAHV